ncbi:hypothetical protein RCL1_000416 [Eukaryota sp. TZLM3-RCL]
MPRTRSDSVHRPPAQIAVVVPSSFSSYYPFSNEIAESLFPFVNATLLDYTFEALDTVKVDEIYVICAGVHASDLSLLIRDSKWSSRKKIVPLILSQSLQSVCGALKQIEENVTGDKVILLIDGCILSNISLESIFELHNERRSADPTVSATIVMSPLNFEQSSLGISERFISVFEKNTSNLVALNHVNHSSSSDNGHSTCTKIKASFLPTTRSLSVRSDLFYTGIAVLSAEFTANGLQFVDAKTIPAMVSAILSDFELLNIKVNAHISKSNTFCRIDSVPSLIATSIALTKRWLYPLAPEVSIHPDSKSVELSRLGCYKGTNTFVNSDAVVGRFCVIGDDATVCSKVHLQLSVIGKKTTVSGASTIVRSFVGENCRIGEGVRINDSVIANDCFISNGVVIESHCAVGPFVFLPSDYKLPKGTHVSTVSFNDDVEETFNVTTSDGNTLTLFSINYNVEGVMSKFNTIYAPALPSISMEYGQVEKSGVSSTFIRDYVELVDHFLDSGDHNWSNFMTELQSIRMSHGMNASDAVIVFFLTLIECSINKVCQDPESELNHEQSDKLIAVLDDLVIQFMEVFSRFLSIDDEEKRLDEEVAMLEHTIDTFERHYCIRKMFDKILVVFYNHNVVSYSAARQWYSDLVRNSEADELDEDYKDAVVKFIDFLNDQRAADGTTDSYEYDYDYDYDTGDDVSGSDTEERFMVF